MTEKKSVSLATAIAVIVALLLKFFVIDITRVYGHSMEPALKPGNIIVSLRAYYGLLLPYSNRYVITWRKPARGEILVLQNPMEATTIVKRCIGIEGDLIRIEQGDLVVGSTRIEDEVQRTAWELNLKIVPKGHVFVVGDNAEQSVDSRSFGFVPFEQVIGRVLTRRTHAWEPS